jgi:hypothetical protein
MFSYLTLGKSLMNMPVLAIAQENCILSRHPGAMDIIQP